VPFNTPLYEAGVDSGDIIGTIDGQPATEVRWKDLSSRRPGEQVTIGVVRRDGTSITRTIAVKADPTANGVVSMEAINAAQRAFRSAWLGTKIE
jgi:C-terminal processing protease CtpA/Prc